MCKFYLFHCFAVFFALILLAFLACLFCGVCGSGAHARRSNPSRDTGSKRLCNQDEALEGSSAPQCRTKTTATKLKEPTKGMDEIPLAEFASRRKINPYVNPCANLRENELFWTNSRTSFIWM